MFTPCRDRLARIFTGTVVARHPVHFAEQGVNDMKLFYTFLAITIVGLAGCQKEPAEAPPADEPTGSAEAADSSAASPAAGTAESAQSGTQANRPALPGEGDEKLAVAEITPTEGNQARGSVELSGGNGATRIAGTITGLKAGAHGLHIHAIGDCNAPDASSAGDHFNPDDDPHGSPQDLDDAHHVGDLGNVTANEKGEAEVNIEDDEIALSGAESVIGKALIVHSGQDDFETQPSGDSGSRVGCGEIEETARQAAIWG